MGGAGSAGIPPQKRPAQLSSAQLGEVRWDEVRWDEVRHAVQVPTET